jgi:hypothetical protein
MNVEWLKPSEMTQPRQIDCLPNFRVLFLEMKIPGIRDWGTALSGKSITADPALSFL